MYSNLRTFLIGFSFLWLITSCKQKKDTLFQSLSSAETHIDFANNLEKKPLFNILYYLYYYNGGGVATGDINNDGLTDIYFTANAKGHNKLYLNKGNFKFEDITEKAGVAGTSDWCTGVTMADVNGDGFLDIYVSSVSQFRGLKGHNELFINEGNNKFSEQSKEYGLDFSGFTTQTAFFDYDHDGDLDCYMLNQSHQPNQNIKPATNRTIYNALSGDRLYRNDSPLTPEGGTSSHSLIPPSGLFTDVSAEAGISQSNLGYGLGIAVADVNNDGWEDIYIGNDFHENDYYYINSPLTPEGGTKKSVVKAPTLGGARCFVESGEKYFNHYSRFSMGNDIADYNNDGQLDIITVDMLPRDEKILKTYGSDENIESYYQKLIKNGFQYQFSKNCLQHNNGDGSSFSETSLLSNVAATDWSWSPLFADFDNDGNKDLFISSGIVKRPVDLDYIKFVSDLYMKASHDKTDKYDDEALENMPDGASNPFLFKGDGNMNFENVSNAWGTGDMKGYFNGASYADLDNDGNLDIIINSLNAPAVILKNNAPKKNAISISFKGNNKNTFGIGTKAYIFQQGKIQYQQLMLTRGFQSSSDTKLHFGLGDNPKIDSILVVWNNQQYEVIKNVSPNEPIVFSQNNAKNGFNYQTYFPTPTPLLTNITEKIKVPWQHAENQFIDFNSQYLIPHAESTRGPKIAVGDVNGDKLDDFFVCGAADQIREIQIQQKNGTFLPIDREIFEADIHNEDVDATFFDANNDGKLDLYVVSGGNMFTGEIPTLLDRLYLNTGNGHFVKSAGALPKIFADKSCVTTADIDNDGDQDIFVGTLTKAQEYGIPQTSYLLINDGKGHFSIAPENVINLTAIGMVTSAKFADINKDNFQELIIAGEFMPIIIFNNEKGKFTANPLVNSTGWWQNIEINDVDNDGNLDILAGNWGYNNKFWSGKNGPVRMYTKDFDNNDRIDQLLSYTLEGKEYPFLPKDEIERPLPVLKKHYVKYADYAGLEMKDAFLGFVEQVKPLQAEKLGSAVVYGNGKGGFSLKDLPINLQKAPIFAFQKVKNNNYLVGGNFFEVLPYEGRYDAQSVALFSSNKNIIQQIPQQNLAAIKGQIRDIKMLRTINNKAICVIVLNNEPLLFFQ